MSQYSYRNVYQNITHSFSVRARHTQKIHFHFMSYKNYRCAAPDFILFNVGQYGDRPRAEHRHINSCVLFISEMQKRRHYTNHKNERDHGSRRVIIHSTHLFDIFEDGKYAFLL